MKNKFQYVIAGAGITLIVIFGTFTLLLPRVQAGESLQDTAGQTKTSARPAHANGTEAVSFNNQEQPGQVTDNITGSQNTSAATAEEPAEEFFASLGTKDKPQTNMDIIIYTVSELARKQEEALMGKTGWLHVKVQFYIPEEQKGNGYHSAAIDEIIPIEVLVPQNPIFDSWYHVDETGLYREALSLVMAPDGTIHQQSVLVDGVWVNLTLKALGTHQQQYETPGSLEIAVLPTAEVYRILEESQTWPDVSMQAYMENGRYVVIKEQRYDDPIENAVFMPEPVIGGKEIYYFDQETGELLYSEVQSLLQSEVWYAGGNKTYLTVEFLPEMPVEISRLFNDLVVDARK
ncbi:MAG: hypothetical protein D6835_01445 [Candidatus Thermofonsia bacterium]|nr:MAG: hypothetical protein D6835_01445 [Candidatus Thermofonsia bacterium]